MEACYSPRERQVSREKGPGDSSDALLMLQQTRHIRVEQGSGS